MIIYVLRAGNFHSKVSKVHDMFGGPSLFMKCIHITMYINIYDYVYI